MITYNVEAMKENKFPRRSFYRSHLAPIVVKAFDEFLEASREDQLEILEEIALLRETASHTVELYSAARELHHQSPSQQTAAMVLQTSVIMREALNEVVKAVEVAKKLDIAGRNKIGISSFTYFISQMMHIVNDAIGDTPDGERIAHKIGEGLTNLTVDMDELLEHGGGTGRQNVIATSYTPDMACRSMDMTVPDVNGNGNGDSNSNSNDN